MKSPLFHINLLPAAMAVATVTMLTACSDELPGTEPQAGGRSISFAVSTATASAARSESATAAAGSATLVSAGADTLYMSACLTPGITPKSTMAVSRGSSVTDDNLSDFGVYASLGSTGDYMWNVEVERNGDSWAPAREYLWPGDGALHFNAYAPYTAAIADEGITVMPDATAGSLALSYVTPAAAENQTDLLVAVPVDAASSPCHLNFNHAMGAVRFATGAKMPPCTVKEIILSGVLSTGVLDLESGDWSSLGSATSFTLAPDKELAVGSDGAYVAAGTAINDDEHTLMLIPQTLGEDATLSLTVESNGSPTTYTASVAGMTIIAGTTLTFHLSAGRDSQLILTILDSDGKPVTALKTAYTGGVHHFTVNSHYTDANGTITPIEWEASFLDADGNPGASAPDWIISFPAEGSGDTECTMTADMPEPVFMAMNEHTARLRSAADINSSTGTERYNLASSTGGAAVENTANCYVINAPGKYSLPLVYGNAIKNGAANSAAYVSTRTRSTLLKNFVNHLGNAITDPYIYNNSGCTPADAVLVWEGRLNMVRDVALSADGKSIEFDIPAASIRQGNAVVAVCDKNGTVMWSWHLWVTDVKPSDSWVSVDNGSVVYSLQQCNLGQIYGGDVTQFLPSAVTVRFTQKNVPEGNQPLTVDIPVSQETATITTPNCHPYYQWGRKDPMISGIKEFYDAAHNELDGIHILTADFGTNHLAEIEASIQHPGVFYHSTEDNLSDVSPFYQNLWNINMANPSLSASNPQNVKTVYDPCPVGMKVPIGNSFLVLKDCPATRDNSAGIASITLPDSKGTLEFFLSGYRSLDGGDAVLSDGAIVGAWSASSGGTGGKARYLVIHSNSTVSTETHVATIGFGVRPAKD